MMPNIMSVKQWNELVKTNIDDVKKLEEENKENWNMLKYYSNMLLLGSKLGYIVNTTVPMLAMTRNIENIDAETFIEYYNTFEYLTVLVHEEMFLMSEHILKLCPEPDKVNQEFVS